MKPSALGIHVLGAGSIGGLVAHELQIANPESNIMILCRTLEAAKRYNSQLTVNRVHKDGNMISSTTRIRSGTAATVLDYNPPLKIENLIVSTKAYQTPAALAPYTHLLSNTSNVLFIHNGMGVIDKCIDRFWSRRRESPRIFKAVVTHGAYKTSPNIINHVGLGKMTISRIPNGVPFENEDIPQMIQNILQNKPLNATYTDYDTFVLKEIEKLAVNACVNPLTAILDCKNGDLLKGKKVFQMMMRVIWELVATIRVEYKPLFIAMPEASTVIDPKRLLDAVIEVIENTASNSSSMREDVRNLSPTEIDYINGYISKLGKKHSISTPTNNMLVSMIKTKYSIDRTLENNASEFVINQQ
ncbi:2-dehydropantoate 2-reductase (Ketopantoate reductase) (KPA reductase) (KPR) [Yamadazyma tenuis]|uniref:2-dehydropantoate 2-reductase n=1 Tax=Candida tenuis (strain ATCC 10573 / BCRC 21748 / CBS 615 / JCM 9827 / NBRC 10315 / NRRL Y-1498 / VKM Y-70) TaxID=590646 RepID=G3B9G0_CANTC|nr:uncharacterized protein CANTEDRAFT_108239 [Yamadazyma tenuis ATCC 10573]EGV61877.1 hypothetical protein CANTEDRAFT_108239 [Yamadazyma tenuis ATCC 10573]WEJ93107.1 2-dehydropantoate 2-reductase (Ketopantoate reductase) (KPA reductase) (KPR) [Yamadazyma tenuis]